MSESRRRFFLLRWRRGGAEDSVDLEMSHHLEMRVDELIEQGLRPDEARRAALEAFGDRARHRAECVSMQRRRERRMRGMEVVMDLWRDVLIGLRGLRKNPVFTATMLATLGVGVGANTAIFTVVDAVLVRPLPYPNAERLVEVGPRSPESGFRLNFFYKESALAWRDESGIFDATGFRDRAVMVWMDRSEPRRLQGNYVTPGLIRMLGVAPLLGRSFDDADAAPGAAKVVLLGEALWRSAFGADPEAVGATMVLDGDPHVIVGVMPHAFRYPRAGQRDMWIALGDDRIAAGTERMQLRTVGLLPEGADAESVLGRAEAFQAGLVEAGVELTGFPHVAIGPLAGNRANPDIRQALWLVMSGVGVILLIAGLNAANLLLIRGASRWSEIGVRLAMGGGRGRVVRQVAVEGMLLAVGAGVVAVAISASTLGAILSIAPTQVVEWSPTPIELSGRVIGFTFALAGVVGALFGVLPALSTVRAAEGACASLLGARSVAGRAGERWRSALVVGEVAMSVVLIVGAGLLVKSFNGLVHKDHGWDPSGLIQLSPGLIAARYQTTASQRAFFDEARERIAALPGVASVTLAGGIPPSTGITFGGELMAEGREAPAYQPDAIPFAEVDERFLTTLGVELIAGRNFGPEDTPEARSRIIDVEMARALFGEDAPLGKRFRLGEDGNWMTVVGVVLDLHLEGLDDRGLEYDMLVPLAAGDASSYSSLGIRTDSDPLRLFGAIRRIVGEIDPGQPIDRLALVEDELVQQLEGETFLMRLMTVFALIALVLAGTGIFGVVSSLVQQRRRELGIRVALGADRRSIHAMVLRRGLSLAGLGVVLGAVGAVLLGDVIEAVLRDVSTSDPGVVGGAALVAVLACMAAVAWPARRAMQVDPMRVLGAE